MPRRVVIGVGIASYPLHAAGNTWAFLQWVLGFRVAGWDVWIVEDLARAKCLDREGKTCAPKTSANLAHWNTVIREFGLEEQAVPFLWKAIHDDPNFTVRNAAIDALGKIEGAKVNTAQLHKDSLAKEFAPWWRRWFRFWKAATR